MENKPTLFGALLEQMRLKRKSVHEAAVRDLQKRNKITPGSPGYKIEHTSRINREGVEVTEYRLYKLLDCSVTSMRANVESKVEIGLSSIQERLR